jgi:hypothetical protein
MQFDSSMNPGALDVDSLVKPGFDIIMAVSSARQTASPTARCVHAWETARANSVLPAARRSLLSRQGAACSTTVGLARFYELSDVQADTHQNVNDAFTRAFQPMLNVLPVDPVLGGQPDHSDEENMD